jgi:hypothetical protein
MGPLARVLRPRFDEPLACRLRPQSSESELRCSALETVQASRPTSRAMTERVSRAELTACAPGTRCIDTLELGIAPEESPQTTALEFAEFLLDL